ncbi:MAG TPA: DNA primase [Tissierellaceae bacterium]|nr:DNA primase [Tissierellaceae bacterium]
MTSFINNEIIEKVKDRSDIVEVVSDYLPLKKAGSNYVGLCPFHNEKTPSFSVSNSKQFFHCFGCGVGGDSIEFIMKKENLEFVDAIKLLADKYGIEIKETKVDPEYIKEKDRAYEINRETARFFYNNLNKNKKAMNYLKKRNIDSKTLRRFGLGYSIDSWDNLYNHLTNKGYKAKDIAKLGLIAPRKKSDGYYDKFRNRIMFPIIDTRSRVIGFGGRIMDDSMPKYLNSQESIIFDKSNCLYGLNLVNKYSNRERILLVEGYMDVMALFSKGINYSVASLGTSLTERQAKLLKRFGKEVYICYDSDRAGIKATLRAIDILTKENIEPRIIVLPDDMDPDDYINKVGLARFEKLFSESYNYMDYRIDIIKSKYDLTKAEDKIKFTTEVGELIKKLKSSIEQDVYIKKISKDTDISIDAIKAEMKKINYKKKTNYKKTYTGTQNITPVDSEVKSGKLKAELDLLRLMIEDKDYFRYIDENLSVNDLSSEDCKKIFQFIREEYNNSEFIKIEDIIDKARKNNIYSYIFRSIIEMDIKYDPTNIEDSIKDLINTILYKNLKKQREDILKEISDYENKVENDQENDYLSNLILELTRLNNEIKFIK